MSIANNLAEVRDRMAEAARRAGRSASDITLVAVSKTFGVDVVREAWDAGQREFGENKVQEGLQKIAVTADISPRWHLIGHLQSNKAKKAAASFSCIQSVDSVELLLRLDEAAVDRPPGSAPLEVLVQVDFAGEATKFGAPPDDAMRAVRAGLDARHLRLAGLMLLPPWSDDAEQSRPWFARLREFRDRLVQEGVPAPSLRHLSMGMSHDYHAAVEEGSTIVRVGTAIFGARRAPQLVARDAEQKSQ
jgi:pyridoxal phosphate enzyme (YggS family)